MGSPYIMVCIDMINKRSQLGSLLLSYRGELQERRDPDKPEHEPRDVYLEGGMKRVGVRKL